MKIGDLVKFGEGKGKLIGRVVEINPSFPGTCEVEWIGWGFNRNKIKNLIRVDDLYEIEYIKQWKELNKKK